MQFPTMPTAILYSMMVSVGCLPKHPVHVWNPTQYLQPDDFKGDVKLIQSELPELSSTPLCLTNLDFNLIGSRFAEQHWICLREN